MANIKPAEIELLGKITENSQAGSVISTEGVCFTLCAGNHGYAMGYILEKTKVKENDGKSGS